MEWKLNIPNVPSFSILLKKHLSRVLDIVLNDVQEGDGFSTVNQSMIVCYGDIHHLLDSS